MPPAISSQSGQIADAIEKPEAGRAAGGAHVAHPAPASGVTSAVLHCETLGIAGALGVGAIFESANLLVHINGRDPVTIGSIALLLAIVSLAASTWPARRATQLDPLVALRRD